MHFSKLVTAKLRTILYCAFCCCNRLSAQYLSTDWDFVVSVRMRIADTM